MRRLAVCLAIFLALAANANAQQLSDDEKKEGFISLFNGKDFSGWRFAPGSALGALPKNWSTSDGLIHLHGGGNPHLASQWSFDDFEARFQWKALKTNYNSGFYVRSGRNVGANQINLAMKAAGNLMGGAKGGNAVPELQKAPGEWNEWKVLAEGDKLTFWCNGKQAWSVIGFSPASGYLGIQAEGAAIDIKNFMVRELGYRVLSDLSAWSKAAGWTQDGDVLKSTGTAEKLATATTHRDGKFRLEYQGKGSLAFAGTNDAKITFGDGELAKLENPAGQWNYLQVTLAQGKATLWLNGTDIKTPVQIGTDPGAIRVVPIGDLMIRGARIRDTK